MSRIDVHSHYLPEAYRAAATLAGHAQPDGMPALPAWSVESALQLMDQNDIEASILSVSSPGVFFGDVAGAQSLARAVNEAGAEAVATHPSRFGLFASLPLPDVDAALTEIAYVFDTLHADGVVLMSNYGGVRLGDAAFDRVFDELNRREAVIFMHPTSPVCISCGERGMLGFPGPMLEFMFESTRAVTNLAYSGTFTRCPDIRFIMPHAGAALPLLSDRVARFVPIIGGPGLRAPDEFGAILGRLYYDLAGYPVPKMLAPLLSVAAPDRILYGSDWPFTPSANVNALTTRLDNSGELQAIGLEQVMQGNARPLFPRLAV
ncbi:MAG: amidohydrolase family protein [Dehalococcoidia bacterium]